MPSDLLILRPWASRTRECRNTCLKGTSPAHSTGQENGGWPEKAGEVSRGQGCLLEGRVACTLAPNAHHHTTPCPAPPACQLPPTYPSASCPSSPCAPPRRRGYRAPSPAGQWGRTWPGRGSAAATGTLQAEQRDWLLLDSIEQSLTRSRVCCGHWKTAGIKQRVAES